MSPYESVQRGVYYTFQVTSSEMVIYKERNFPSLGKNPGRSCNVIYNQVLRVRTLARARARVCVMTVDMRIVP